MAGAFFAAVAFLQRLGPTPMEWIAALGCLLVLVTLAWGLSFGPAVASRHLPHTLQMLLHVSLPFALLPHFFGFGTGGYGPEALLGLFALLWTNDTGAYLTGRAFGRTALLPAISPKKTVEGLFGGIAATLVLSYGLAQWWDVLTTGQWMASAIIVSTAATIGDLLESAMKRTAGVKDSGIVLPGHGGILDRFDGLLLASPAMFAYLLLVR